MWQCIARDLAGEADWVTIQTLYRDCSQLKNKRQGRALCRDTMHCQAHDTASGAQQGLRHGRWGAATRRWGAGHGAGMQDTARARACALRYSHAGRDTTGQLGHDTIVVPTTRPGMRALMRACVPNWASFGAHAPRLVFDLVFRLGIVSESPFGPGS